VTDEQKYRLMHATCTVCVNVGMTALVTFIICGIVAQGSIVQIVAMCALGGSVAVAVLACLVWNRGSAEPRVTGSRPNRAAAVLAVVGALVGGWFLYDHLRVGAQHDPLTAGLLTGVAIAMAVGWFKWQDRRNDDARDKEVRRLREQGESSTVSSTDPRFLPDRSWVAPVAIVLVFAGYGAFDAHNARDNYVRPYCLYGAQSQAQLDGCMSHVTSEDINALDTQAATFAAGQTSDCLDDSGPFCEQAAQWNSLDPNDP